MTAPGKVAVLAGGRSAEREVSLATGAAVLAALRRRGVRAQPIDPTGSELVQLAGGGFDRAFIAVHGHGGEDGTVQGALETIELPYTGSGVLGSALAMDKLRAKWLWQACDIPTPAFRLVRAADELAAAGEALGFPLFVKPNAEGSSLGVSPAPDAAGLLAAWQAARAYDAAVLVERAIEGPELTVAILDEQVLPLIRLDTPRAFYDYVAKYEADTTVYRCPAGLPPEQEQTLQALSLRAFQVLGCSGWGRVDLMLDGQGNPFVLEVNTVPGLTAHSLVPKAARQAGMDFDELVMRILETSHVAS